MKTKNKYKIYEFFVFLVWLIATVFLVYLVSHRYQEEFTIYKIECHNETFINQELCKRIPKECPSGDEDAFCFNVVCPQCYDKPCNLYLNKEVCDKTEVDEITYRLDCSEGNYNREDYPEKCISKRLCDGDCYRAYTHYFPVFKDDLSPKEYLENCVSKCDQDVINISKKDLTKEFLENPNNCECIQCEPLNLEKEWGWESIRDGNKIMQCSKECLKYKCFDKYFVEVNS